MFERTKAAKEQLDNYKNALFFLLFAALYCAVLYLQADASESYDVAIGHQPLIPQGFANTQQNSFAGPAALYSWLNDSVVQVRASPMPTVACPYTVMVTCWYSTAL